MSPACAFLNHTYLTLPCIPTSLSAHTKFDNSFQQGATWKHCHPVPYILAHFPPIWYLNFLFFSTTKQNNPPPKCKLKQRGTVRFLLKLAHSRRSTEEE